VDLLRTSQEKDPIETRNSNGKKSGKRIQICHLKAAIAEAAETEIYFFTFLKKLFRLYGFVYIQ